MSHFSGSLDLNCKGQFNQVPLCTNLNSSNKKTMKIQTNNKSNRINNDKKSVNQVDSNCYQLDYNRQRRSQLKGQMNLINSNLLIVIIITSLGLLCYAEDSIVTINKFKDCGINQFKCKSGQCIAIDRAHNGFKDCSDGSDEDCPENQHKCLCGLPVCLDKSRVNDGKKDCIDGSDEGHADTNLCRYDTSELTIDEVAKNGDKLKAPKLVSSVLPDYHEGSSSINPENQLINVSTTTTTSIPLVTPSFSSILSSPAIVSPTATTEDIFVEVTGTFVPYEQLRPFRPAVASSVIALPQYSSIVPTGSRSVIEITGTFLSGSPEKGQQEPPSSSMISATSVKPLARTSIVSASTEVPSVDTTKSETTTNLPTTLNPFNSNSKRFLVTVSRAPVSKSNNKVKLFTGFISINGTKYNLLTVNNGTDNDEVTITINDFHTINGKSLLTGDRRVKTGEVAVNLNHIGLSLNLPVSFNEMTSSHDLLFGNAVTSNQVNYRIILISDANKVKFENTPGSTGLELNHDKLRPSDLIVDGSDTVKDELVDLIKLSVNVHSSHESLPKNVMVKSTLIEDNDEMETGKLLSNKIKPLSGQSGLGFNRKLVEPKEQFVAYGLENIDSRSTGRFLDNGANKLGSGSPISSVTPSYINTPTRRVTDNFNELSADSEIADTIKYQSTPSLDSIGLISKSVPVYERPSSRVKVNNQEQAIKSTSPSIMGTTTIFGFIDFTTTINGSLVVFTPNTKSPISPKNDKRKWKSTSTSGLQIQPTPSSGSASGFPSMITTSAPYSSVVLPVASSINIRDNLKLRSRSKLRPKIEPTSSQPLSAFTEPPSDQLTNKFNKFGKHESINFNPIVSSKEVKLSSSYSEFGLPSLTYQLANRQSSTTINSQIKPTSTLPTGLLSSFTGTISGNQSLTEWTTLVIGTFIKGTYAHILESKSRIYPKQESTQDQIQSSKPLILFPSSSSSNQMSSIQPPARLSPKQDLIKPSHQITITSGFILPTAASALDSSSSTVTSSKDQSSSSIKSSPLPSSSLPIELSSSIIEPETISTSSQSSIEPTKSLEETLKPSSSEYSSPSSTTVLTFTPIRAHVTTYTYYTTYFKDGSMLVSSHKEVVTNTQSAVQSTPSLSSSSSTLAQPLSSSSPSSSASTSSAMVTPSSKVILPVTFYTTYTYYTTHFNGGSPTIKSREETITRVSTPGENESTQLINPTSSPVDSIIQSTPSNQIKPTESLSIVSPSFSSIEPSINLISRKPTAPVRTYYTTYTYFTTYLRGGSKSIASRFETITNVASGENEIDKTSSPGNQISPTAIVKPAIGLTRFTTYTFYTTYVKSGSTVVSTSKKTITNVATVPKETTRPTGAIRQSIKPSKSARTELITFTYFTTKYNQGKPTVSSRFETISSVINEPAFGQRSSIKPSLTLSSVVPLSTSSYDSNNLLSPSVTFDQPFATETPPLIDSSFNFNGKSSSSLIQNDANLLSSSKTPELPMVPEIKDMTSLDLNSLLAGLKVPITRYTTYTYFTTLGQGVSRSTVTRTQVVSNVVTDTIKLSLPSSSSSSVLSSSLSSVSSSAPTNQSVYTLNRRAPVLDELEAASDENRPQHAHDRPVTFYTTTTHYTTILLPTGGSTILSNIDVRASVTRLASDQILPTRETEPLSSSVDSEPFASSIDSRSRPIPGNDQIETTLSTSISPPSRYDYGTNQVEVVSTVNIHKTRETDPLLTYETTLTYFTTFFDGSRPSRTETRRETVTEIRRNSLINPSSTRKPTVIRRTRLRGGARDILPDPRDGSHLTRKPVVVITKKPIEPTVTLAERPFASVDPNHHHHGHLDAHHVSGGPIIAPSPITYFTTHTYFTTELVGGFPVVRSREQVFSTIIKDRILPTRGGFGLRPTISFRAKRSLNDGDDLIMEESNLDPMAFELPGGDIVSKFSDSDKSEFSEGIVETEDELRNANNDETITVSSSSSSSSNETKSTKEMASAAFSQSQPSSSSSLVMSPSSVSVLISPSSSSVSLDSMGSPSNPQPQPQPVGIISSQISSVINDGITTLFTTQIYGTYIGTIYAHLAKTQTSQLSPSPSSSPQVNPSTSLPTGLISESVRSEIHLGTTTLYKTQVHGTFINGVYAHFGQVTSTLIDSHSPSTVELTQSPISVLTSTEINSDKTTIHTSEIYQTMISGFSAQFTRTTSSIVPESSTVNTQLVSPSVSSTSTRPFLVFPSRKHRGSNAINANGFGSDVSSASIVIQTVTKTVTATPVTESIPKSAIVELGLGEDRDLATSDDVQGDSNSGKNSIVNDDELKETEYFDDNRESGSEKVEVDHRGGYDPEAHEDVHHEDAVEHPTRRIGRRLRPTREGSRYYDYEGPPADQPSVPSTNDETSYGSSQNSRFNLNNDGRYSGYADPYSSQPLQPAPLPVQPVAPPVAPAAPQARYKGVFGQRVGSSGRSSSPVSPPLSSPSFDYDSYSLSAPISQPQPQPQSPPQPQPQPALIPHSRGRFAADSISTNRQASQSPAPRAVEVLQPFQNVHESLSDRVYPSNPPPSTTNRRTSSRSTSSTSSSSQSGRRRSSSSSSRSNEDPSFTAATPRPTIAERPLVSRYQSPKRQQAQQSQPQSNGRSNRGRPSSRGSAFNVQNEPVAARVQVDPPVEDPIIEEEVYIEPSPQPRGRNHFSVSPRVRSSGKTRRIILNNNPEPSRPPPVAVPVINASPSPSLYYPPSLLASSSESSPPLPTPDVQKTPITITSLVSVIKTLPIRHGFLTSYATITTTAFNRSVINPNEYQLRLNPTNTIETLTIYSSSTIEPTKVRETLITTTTLLEVKLVPIRIGFSTRTDTLTDTQVLTTFTTSDRTIHPTVHHAYPFPGLGNDPNAVAAGGNAFLPSGGIPYLHGGIIGGGNGAQITFSQVTATITGITTLSSTRVVSLTLHGKTLLSTLTLTSTLATTSVTTSLVPIPLAPSIPQLITSQPPMVTTSLTIQLTGDSGDVTELITVLTIPGQIFNTKVKRSAPSIESTPVNFNQMFPIEKTLAPSMFSV
ncbi:mucin-5AC-like isoform X2 [Panonychus citri]|uniref:mucin-5AC-like isoform X2 n=1 Tax=Panonychus citri TaxID=50023 RepID=UPI002307CAED|nr:mucin-5AC-like isoform X2 [Panonychus citri]